MKNRFIQPFKVPNIGANNNNQSIESLNSADSPKILK